METPYISEQKDKKNLYNHIPYIAFKTKWEKTNTRQKPISVGERHELYTKYIHIPKQVVVQVRQLKTTVTSFELIFYFKLQQNTEQI